MMRSWFFPQRANDFRVESWPPPLSGRWIQTWIQKLRHKRTGEQVEERRISVKLPVYGYYYAINVDEERWGQLTFQYCGQRGCFFAPIFSVEGSGMSSIGSLRLVSGGSSGFSRG